MVFDIDLSISSYALPKTAGTLLYQLWLLVSAINSEGIDGRLERSSADMIIDQILMVTIADGKCSAEWSSWLSLFRASVCLVCHHTTGDTEPAAWLLLGGLTCSIVH